MATDLAPRGAATRPEIQALRAVAIGAVLVYHFWPRGAPSGFAGVDVFFVVSGFLITGLLVRDVAVSGRVDLTTFYIRRARRIIPAALVVLATCALATLAFVPRVEWRPFLQQILSSALYVENWHLARDSQIPRRADLESTPVQHFWSLSVEEQFYLLWPLLIITAVVLARRSSRRMLFVAVVLGAATLASFVHGVTLTAVDHNLAYFSTFARAWEFGVGGLLALAPAVRSDRLVRTRALAGWLGLIAIVVSVVSYTDPELFPGYLALVPVLGTALVIGAGMPGLAWSVAPLARLGIVQWFGGISYSLYLWHWPIIMFTPYITGQPSEAPVMLLLLGLTIAVAAASKRWIEDPFRAPSRRNERSTRTPKRVSFRALAIITASLFIVATGVVGYTVEKPRHALLCESERHRDDK